MLLKYNGKPVNAVVPLPGSKSISNRLLILKEVLQLPTKLVNLSAAKDTQDLETALNNIKNKNTSVIDVGHAGTSMRFLTAFLAQTKGEWILTGSERMKDRPVKPLVDALKYLGAEISYLEKEGFPPLKIIGKKLNNKSINIDGSISSQFISALLLTLISQTSEISITLKNKIASWSYILMTIDLMREFGLNVSTSNNTISVKPFKTGELILLDTYHIEADWSSASYWFSIVALSKNAEITLRGLHEKSSQGDSVLPKVYSTLGVSAVYRNNYLVLKKIPPTATFFEYDFSNCPDIAQTVAATCLGLKINCKLTGLGTLIHKETDRLGALKTELEKFGSEVIITNNSLELINKKNATGEVIAVNTYNDHRMAMSFAPLVFCLSQIKINEPAVVVKSYPTFWKHLELAGVSVS